LGTYATLTDADLVVQAKAGDRNAFAVLYDRWFDPLHDFLVRMTRNRDEAAELVQDTFLVAMQRLESLTQPDRFKSWLFQIAYRRTLDRLERSKRWQLTSPTPGVDGETNALLVQASANRLDDPEDAAEANEVAALVWEAARSLDDRTFAVLDLHVRQGLSSAEIAEVLDVKPNHAYVLVNRMKERVGGAIGTFLLVTKGRRDCSDLQATVAGADLPPVTEDLRKRVDRHVSDCETCQERRRRLLAPIQAYGALAAVPARAGVKDEIWRTLDRAWPTGRLPSFFDRWRHVAAILGAVGLVAVLPVLLVLALAGGGSAAPTAFDDLTASPVDLIPEAVPSFGVRDHLVLPPPPPYEPPPEPTAEPTASASPTETPAPGQPPIVTIIQPTPGQRFEASAQDGTGPYAIVRLGGAADDVDSAPANLTFAWSSSVDGALGSTASVGGVKLHITGYTSQCNLLNPLGSAQTTHTIDLVVTDETGAVGTQSVEVTIEVPCNKELPSEDPSPSPSPSPQPTFTVACSEASGTGPWLSDCTATADEGYSGQVEWRCANQPAWLTCNFRPGSSTLPDGGSATTQLEMVASAPQSGEYQVTIVGAAGGTTRSTVVTIVVR